MSNRALDPSAPARNAASPGVVDRPGLRWKGASLLFSFGLLLSGCTSVVFTHPSGQPVPAADADDFKGEWIGEKGKLWRVDREPGAPNLVVHWNDNDKDQSCSLVFTQVRGHVAIVWVEEKELGGYMPLRISGAEDALALLYPKVDEVKRLVAEGRLTGTFNPEKNYWLIANGDWDAALENPAFWEIDNCLPFVRSRNAAKPPPAPSPVPAAHPSPPAASRP
jgi:hypothetical protein